MPKDILKNAFLNAVLTAVYVAFVAMSMFYVPKALGLDDTPDTVLMPVFMLLLLVFSVALVGTLIFGRPVLWYLNGRKKDAVTLLLYTLGIFFLITVVAFLKMILLANLR